MDCRQSPRPNPPSDESLSVPYCLYLCVISSTPSKLAIARHIPMQSFRPVTAVECLIVTPTREHPRKVRVSSLLGACSRCPPNTRALPCPALSAAAEADAQAQAKNDAAYSGLLFFGAFVLITMPRSCHAHGVHPNPSNTVVLRHMGRHGPKSPGAESAAHPSRTPAPVLLARSARRRRSARQSLKLGWGCFVLHQPEMRPPCVSHRRINHHGRGILLGLQTGGKTRTLGCGGDRSFRPCACLFQILGNWFVGRLFFCQKTSVPPACATTARHPSTFRVVLSLGTGCRVRVLYVCVYGVGVATTSRGLFAARSRTIMCNILRPTLVLVWTVTRNPDMLCSPPTMTDGYRIFATIRL